MNEQVFFDLFRSANEDTAPGKLDFKSLRNKFESSPPPAPAGPPPIYPKKRVSMPGTTISLNPSRLMFIRC